MVLAVDSQRRQQRTMTYFLTVFLAVLVLLGRAEALTPRDINRSDAAEMNAVRAFVRAARAVHTDPSKLFLYVHQTAIVAQRTGRTALIMDCEHCLWGGNTRLPDVPCPMHREPVAAIRQAMPETII
jgi:hypothetical protein